MHRVLPGGLIIARTSSRQDIRRLGLAVLRRTGWADGTRFILGRWLGVRPCALDARRPGPDSLSRTLGHRTCRGCSQSTAQRPAASGQRKGCQGHWSQTCGGGAMDAVPCRAEPCEPCDPRPFPRHQHHRPRRTQPTHRNDGTRTLAMPVPRSSVLLAASASEPVLSLTTPCLVHPRPPPTLAPCPGSGSWLLAHRVQRLSAAVDKSPELLDAQWGLLLLRE